MTRPNFEFTAYSNSFSVYISNLEHLSVEQIKEIQEFVIKRKGVFDFNKYSFYIQKKLEFEEFVSLIKELGIEANIKEIFIYKKPQPRVGFGQYKGMLFSDLADSYLLWLKNNYHGPQKDDILKEIKKRGI
jgi:uncharacterized protein (DUF3820 family)